MDTFCGSCDLYLRVLSSGSSLEVSMREEVLSPLSSSVSFSMSRDVMCAIGVFLICCNFGEPQRLCINSVIQLIPSTSKRSTQSIRYL